jgi:hypothetical protein
MTLHYFTLKLYNCSEIYKKLLLHKLYLSKAFKYYVQLFFNFYFYYSYTNNEIFIKILHGK